MSISIEPQAAPRRHRPAHRLLATTARQAGSWSVVLACAALVVAAAELAFPAVLGHAVDEVVSGGSAGSWVAWCGAVIAVLVLADAVDDLAAGSAVARSTAWLRRGVFERLLAAGPRHGGLNTGEVTTRLVGNAAEAGRVAPDVVRALVNVVPAVGGTIALALIHPWLCVTFLLGLPVFGVLVRSFARDASALAERYMAVQGDIAGRLVDAVAGARTIAAAGTLNAEAGRVLAPLPELRRNGERMWRAQMRITAQDALVLSLLELAVLGVAGALLAADRVTPGQMLAAAQYVFLAATLGTAVGAVTRITRSRAAAHRLLDVLDRPAVAYGPRAPAPGTGRLELRGVTVRSGGRTVLDGLDLVVEGGSLVAVVGPSGSGKSLLGALAGRLVDPDEGEVLLDGVPLPELGRDELRRAVGYGFERPALLGDDVAEAIALQASEPDGDAVVSAARAARADGFIRALPEGYRTPLERAPMSGGEVQRVGLARAFAGGARVLVLDDVAASLDTVTEHEIAEVLVTELGDRTRIVVAHRPSTAARADRVVWLEGGRVRASGTHGDLWEDPGYRALFAAREDE